MNTYRCVPAPREPGRWAVIYEPLGEAAMPGPVFDTEAEPMAEAERLNGLEDDPQLTADI